MVDAIAHAILVLICLLLVWGVCRQFVVSGAAGLALDHLAIVPQWKFFAQQRIDRDPEAFDDFQLLVRTARGKLPPGAWCAVVHYGERPLRHGFWNPHRYSRSLIAQHAILLARVESEAAFAVQPNSLAYLTVLRFCLDRTAMEPGIALQFAVVQTSGRTGRNPRIGFLSAWHCP